MASYFRIHRIANKFSVTHVREADDEVLAGFVEVGRFDNYNDAMKYAADRGPVTIDFEAIAAR